jgi:hypothetical protein
MPYYTNPHNGTTIKRLCIIVPRASGCSTAALVYSATVGAVVYLGAVLAARYCIRLHEQKAFRGCQNAYLVLQNNYPQECAQNQEIWNVQ